jgi:cation transport regulator ChaC
VTIADGGVWIFGYGSLVWRPAFAHRVARKAWIEGHVRRFWQGSTDHRGVPERPGRVVTIVPDDHPDVLAEARSGRGAGGSATAERCYGTAYHVAAPDVEAVLAGLDHRERGGYERLEVEIGLAGLGSEPGSDAPRRVPGLVYVAGPANDNYLGPASLDSIARQVASATGPSGANADYVFELAAALRKLEAPDEHVFALERALRRWLREGRG